MALMWGEALSTQLCRRRSLLTQRAGPRPKDDWKVQLTPGGMKPPGLVTSAVNTAVTEAGGQEQGSCKGLPGRGRQSLAIKAEGGCSDSGRRRKGGRGVGSSAGDLLTS